MRADLFVLLLLMGFCSSAQPTKKGGDDVARFRRRMATLPPVQRLKPTLDYCCTLPDPCPGPPWP